MLDCDCLLFVSTLAKEDPERSWMAVMAGCPLSSCSSCCWNSKIPPIFTALYFVSKKIKVNILQLFISILSIFSTCTLRNKKLNFFTLHYNNYKHHHHPSKRKTLSFWSTSLPYFNFNTSKQKFIFFLDSG